MPARRTFVASALVSLLLGCNGSPSSDAPTSPRDGGTDAAAPASCPPCVSDKNCAGGTCAQFGGDTFCAPACGAAGECAADRACATVTSFSGEQVSLCVPRGDVCGPTEPRPPPPDAGSDSGLCGTYAPPDLTASCPCPAGKTCAANGCYGGWWCDTATNRCHSSPTGCPGAGDGGTSGFDGGGPGPGPGPGVAYDPGAPITGTVGKDGGAISRLYFAIVGDTRPAVNNDTAGYPTAIITKIWADVAALPVVPPFAVSTGDYMFAAPGSGQTAPQLDLYLGARAAFPNPWFPTMGNHECTGMTASNCGAGTVDGMTSNYTDFLAKLLGPIGQTNPYYAIHIKATDGSWTAKFVFVAANAWTADQATWLDTAMAEKTTYTFVVRHEPAHASAAPGVGPSEAIMAKYPYTLALVGHTHTYGHRGAEVIIGNGGAPLTGAANYGFGMVSQRPDGALAVDVIDYSTGLADSAFHFAVKADGTPAP